jgi:SPP1 family phage portal protein
MAVVGIIPTTLAQTLDTLETAAPAWATNNADWLTKIIADHKSWLSEEGVEKYQAAYDGYLESIDVRDKDRGDGVNNKLQVNYAQLIIDTVVDYLTGKPIVWAFEAPKANPDLGIEAPDAKLVDQYKADLLKLIRTESAQRILAEQLRQGSIAGYGVVIGWVDEYGRIDYDEFPANECIPVYDTRGRLLMLIRYYPITDAEGNEIARVEVYDEKYVTYYLSDKEGSSFTLDDSELPTGNPIAHKAGRVPCSIFVNGSPATYTKRVLKNGVSDLANGVYSLLEAYAAGLSDKANTVDRLLDAYLKLVGVDTDEKEVQLMRKARALVLKGKVGDADASFIAQDQEDKAVENFLTRLVNTIHEQTGTPRLSELAGATATEVKLKYASLDIKAGKKELFFVEAIRQLVAVLTDFLNARRLTQAGVEDPGEIHAMLAGIDPEATAPIPLYNAEWVSFTVNRNLPQNFKEIADIVSELAGKVPDSYLYELLWFIDDPEAALEEMKAQKDADANRQGNAALGFDGTFTRGGNADSGSNTDNGGQGSDNSNNGGIA